MFKSPLTFKITLVIMLILLGYSIGSSFEKSAPVPTYKVAQVQQPVLDIKEFKLLDHNKQPFNLDQLQDKWSLLFLGYTHCPDVCPTTLSEMNYLYQDLQQHNKALLDDAQFILVSIDPERDTPDHLNDYIKYFNDQFTATSGEAEELKAFAKQLELRFSIEKITISDEYLVEHSADLLLINPQAQVVARFIPPYDTGQLVQDYLKLRQTK